MGQAVTRTFTVEGMHCASCGMLIDDALEDLDGVTSSTTSLRAGQAKVDLDPDRCTPDDVIAAIAEAGYTARLAPQ
ncbi:heavy-metal-associated domain-containing protein [Micromonospora aurantiaca (nom. illeg.)]|uniref:heavy-metal-associated domain-containing protein n=1 Tax=Micromonospora aurantiaca (nom. illeg.) TaxID=47850 RepID=UPI0016574AA9|nr:heavy-metal-associated domain-containing protein [Micromonospora aurantiaca]MBC9003654.1 heavy-metal-associated domain-containing protein [Micromonospora aurantiaca]